MSSPEMKKQTRGALALLLLGLLLAAALMSLPLFSFTASVYTKKSSNTFVGDEKYQAAVEEMEQVAEEYRAQGMEVERSETVLERVNSKGETTSLITFSLSQVVSRSLWPFLKTDFSAGWVLRLLVLCLALTAPLALAGCAGSSALLPRYLDRRSRLLRSAACVTAGAGLRHVLQLYLFPPAGSV